MADTWSHRGVTSNPACSFIHNDFLNKISTLSSWPNITVYREIFHQAPFGFVDHHTIDLSLHDGYEAFIHDQQQIPTRSKNWHDFYNALIWHHWPNSKTRLNILQVAENALQADKRNQRTRSQNILTRFDESGAVCFMPPYLSTLLRNKQWGQLFYHQRREFISQTKIYIFGHGLFEKCIVFLRN